MKKYNDFSRPKSLGFLLNPVTKMWDSSDNIDIENFECYELEFNIGNVNGNLKINNLLEFKSLKGLENSVISNNFSLSFLSTLKTLEYFPKSVHSFHMINCPVKSLTGLPNGLTSIIITNCYTLTSLYGLPNTIEHIKIINSYNIPLVERDFVVNIDMHGFNDHYLDLLKFIIKAKRIPEMHEIKWPDGFLTATLIK